MIAAVTGHRPEKLGGYRTPNAIWQRVMEGLDKALLEIRPDYVLVGMALGVDQWMAELCIFNQIPFVAAIPFAGFESRWPMPAQMKFRQILSKAYQTQIICEGEYAPWKMQRRNMWMVDNCQTLIAVYDGSSGGTHNCVEYALSQRRNIHRVQFQPPPPAPAVVRPLEPPPPLRRADVVLRGRAVQIRDLPPQPRRESEGDRIARQTAAAAMRREEERERERAAVIEQRRIRREARRALTILDDIAAEVARSIDVETPVREAASKKEQKEEGPTVREFTRVVDLDL